MGLALYRKYRPKKLADVVGQDHIISTLQNALKTGAISHAYLLTGPRGVGKTSIARILAHEINGLEYRDDSMHLDIIEIDAASNRRIDEIRDLRDKIHIAPTSAKYKVYIIDEVHMLTREAFNALLKTLEEPPEHAVFILATTEAHKVPETIASRTQRFTFKPIKAEDTVRHLTDLAKQEGIKIDKDALQVLASLGGGSFRDSINLLDQLSGSDTKITRAHAESILGIPSSQTIKSIESALHSADARLLSGVLQQARIDGINSMTLAKELAAGIRQDFINGHLATQQKAITLLHTLARITASDDPFTHLELALFGYMTDDKPVLPQLPKTAPAVVKPVPPTKDPDPILISSDKAPAPVTEKALTKDTLHKEEQPPPLVIPEALAEPEEYWPALLTTIKGHHNTLYSMLRMAKPHLEGDVLTLLFSFSFHQKQMSSAANQQRIADAVSALLGRSIEVKSVFSKVGSGQSAEKAAPQSKTKSTLSSVSNIFEGAELLE